MADRPQLISTEKAAKLIRTGKAVRKGSPEYWRVIAEQWERLAEKYVFVATHGRWFDMGNFEQGAYEEADIQREVNTKYFTKVKVLTYGQNRTLNNGQRVSRVKVTVEAPELRKINEPQYAEKIEQHRKKPEEKPDDFLLRSLVVNFVDTYPGKPRKLTLDTGHRVLNLWTPPKVKPCHPQEYREPRWFLKVVDYIFGEHESPEKHYFLDWLAWVACKPEVKIPVSYLLISEKGGIGKSLIAKVMKHIVGERNFKPLTPENLKGSFQPFVLGTVLVVIHELYEGKSADFANKLKVYQSEGDLMVNMKFAPHQILQNRMNFLAFSNDPTPLVLTEGDRRWAVFKSDATGEQPKEWWDEVYSVVEDKRNEGKPNMLELERLRFYFETRHRQAEKLRRFDPFSQPPMSQHKLEVIEDGRSLFFHLMKEMIEGEKLPLDLRRSVSRADILSMLELLQPGFRPPAHQEFSKDMRSLGFTFVKSGKGNRWIAPDTYGETLSEPPAPPEPELLWDEPVDFTATFSDEGELLEIHVWARRQTPSFHGVLDL